MRSFTCIAIFATSALARESATVLNIFGYLDLLTFIGSDASATTYVNNCPSDAVGVTAIPTNLCHSHYSHHVTVSSQTPSLTPFASAPAPTAMPRLRRQDEPCTPFPEKFCEPFTLIQGASTYEYHLTDPVPGIYTVDIACKWQGKVTEADLTCTTALSRSLSESSSFDTTYTSIWVQSDVRDLELYEAYAMVSATGASSGLPSVSASPTASGSGNRTASPTISGSGSGSGVAAQSTGLAPAGPLPTHAMALVGGAVGIFAAALAL